MTTLLSCQPPPPSGYVTVLEHECQFVSAPDDDEQQMPEEREAERRGGGSLHRLMAAAGIQVAHTHICTCTHIQRYTHMAHVRHVCVCVCVCVCRRGSP